jgi:hypothetical protein
MKLIPLLLLFTISIHAFSQTTGNMVTMNGIGDIKVGMTWPNLEKLLKQPLKLKNLLKKDDWQKDTFSVSYKNIPYRIVLDRNSANNKPEDLVVSEVFSSSPLVKTRSGISIGDDKIKIINTYEGYVIYLMPEYVESVKSKTRSTVWLLSDESDTVIVFYLDSNKVTGICVMYFEGC